MIGVGDALAGLPVFVNRYLCTRPFLRWVRTHRRSRIAKKWRKRYGAVYAACPGHAWEVRGLGLVLCPCADAALRQAMTRASKP